MTRRLLAALATATLLASCTIGRVDTRMKYWQEQTDKNLPVGTPLADAQAFFTARGLNLRCCVDAEPTILKSWFASEPYVGRLLWMEYSVTVLVKMSPDDRVENVRVERWGAGFKQTLHARKIGTLDTTFDRHRSAIRAEALRAQGLYHVS